MEFKVGDRVIADKTGRRKRSQLGPLRPGRHGVIDRIIDAQSSSPRFLIRWDVGEPSIYSPMYGGLRHDPEFETAES